MNSGSKSPDGMPDPGDAYRYALSVRIRIGLQRARKNGKKLGRKPNPRPQESIDKILELFMTGWSYRQIETLTGIRRSTCWNIVHQEGDRFRFSKLKEIRDVSSLTQELKKENQNGDKKHI